MCIIHIIDMPWRIYNIFIITQLYYHASHACMYFQSMKKTLNKCPFSSGQYAFHTGRFIPFKDNKMIAIQYWIDMSIFDFWIGNPWKRIEFDFILSMIVRYLINIHRYRIDIVDNETKYERKLMTDLQYCMESMWFLQYAYYVHTFQYRWCSFLANLSTLVRFVTRWHFIGSKPITWHSQVLPTLSSRHENYWIISIVRPIEHISGTVWCRNSIVCMVGSHGNVIMIPVTPLRPFRKKGQVLRMPDGCTSGSYNVTTSPC